MIDKNIQWYLKSGSNHEFITYNKYELEEYLKNLKINIAGKIFSLDDIQNKIPWESLAIMDYMDNLLNDEDSESDKNG